MDNNGIESHGKPPISLFGTMLMGGFCQIDPDVTDGNSEGFQEVLGRGRRERNSGRMAALIANELMDSDDETPSSSRRTRPRSTNKTRTQTSAIATGNSFDPLPVEEMLTTMTTIGAHLLHLQTVTLR